LPSGDSPPVVPKAKHPRTDEKVAEGGAGASVADVPNIARGETPREQMLPDMHQQMMKSVTFMMQQFSMSMAEMARTAQSVGHPSGSSSSAAGSASAAPRTTTEQKELPAELVVKLATEKNRFMRRRRALDTAQGSRDTRSDAIDLMLGDTMRKTYPCALPRFKAPCWGRGADHEVGISSGRGPRV
jgi:hypothetical protein